MNAITTVRTAVLQALTAPAAFARPPPHLGRMASLAAAWRWAGAGHGAARAATERAGAGRRLNVAFANVQLFNMLFHLKTHFQAPETP